MATKRSAKTPGINVKPTPLLVITITTWLAQNMMAGEQAAKFPPFLYEANGAQKIIRYGSEGKVVWGGGFRL